MLPFVCALFVVGIILLIGKLRRSTNATQKCVHIVVLGDLGRSPRMCNHAIQFDLTLACQQLFQKNRAQHIFPYILI